MRWSVRNKMVSLCMSLLGQFVYQISLKNVVDVKLIYVTTFSISICIGFD